MSHRYPKKLKIVEEGEESIDASPHPLDSFFGNPEFFLSTENYEKLSDSQKEELSDFLNSLIPVFKSLFLAAHQLETSEKILKEKYGLTEVEASFLLESVRGMSLIRIQHAVSQKKPVKIHLVYDFSEIAEVSDGE